MAKEENGADTINMEKKQKKNEFQNTRSKGLDNKHYRDSSGKIIFEDPILCAQFLRNYVDIPMLKDVKPEDIEDVTERYIHMFTEERNSDAVKKVYLKNNSFYLVSLIEHKSDVDYNTIMQVFRYPPVLPIVFYDGVDNWTAATRLHERVLFSDILGKYIPDYQCILIQLKNYSTEELMEKKDELSVLMMIDKLRNAADFEKFSKEVDVPFLEEVTEGSPEYLLKLMSQVIQVFLSKLNVPREEAEAFTEQIKERDMGELFKHFEGWDVQALRQEITEAREEAEREKEKAEKEKEKAEKEKEKVKREKEKSICTFLRGIKKYHASKEDAISDLIEAYGLGRENAEEKVALYWQEI